MAALPAVWTIQSFAFTTSLSTRSPQLSLCEGSVRLFLGENDAGTSRGETMGGEISFAAYQESLKRTNGGISAPAGSSDVYQDQYGRTIQRPVDNSIKQDSTPTMNIDTATESQRQPSNDSSAELSDESFMTAITSTTGQSEEPLQDNLSEGASSSISTESQPSNDRGSRRSLVDYSNKFDSFPSQRVGHDRLKPVSRAISEDESKSQDSKLFQPASSSSSKSFRASSAADTSSSLRTVEIMTLSDRMLAFPSQRVGHDRLEPARHGKTTPPTKEDLSETSSSSSSSTGPRKTHVRRDNGYVVADDPTKLCSPFRFLGRPDPNFVIDELSVRQEVTGRHKGNMHDSSASKSVAPDSLL